MVASAEFDPIVVEPGLGPKKAEELITRKRESAKLDYKATYDPQRTRDVVELAKDVVAMANTAGGYMVIGVDDAGEEIGLSEDEAARMDEATLRAQVGGFIGTALELFVDRAVVLQDKRYAIITVLRSPRSPVVFERIGQYQKNAKAEIVPVFRPGDVFVRHGSASERWNQEDVQTIYSRVVEREKERWIAEVLPDVRRLAQGALAGAAQVPTPEEILRSDAESFERALNKLLPRSA